MSDFLKEYGHFYNDSPVSYCIVRAVSDNGSARYRIEYCNKQFSASLHLSPEQLAGKYLTDAYTWLDKEWCDSFFSDLNKAGALEKRLYLPSATSFVSIHGFKLTEEFYSCVISNVLTDDNLCSYYQFSENVGVFCVKIDENFTLIYGNDKFYHYTGYDRETVKEKLGNNCSVFLYEEDSASLHELIDSTLANGGHVIDTVLRAKIHEQPLAYARLSGTLTRYGDDVFLEGTVVDVTRQKAAEYALQLNKERLAVVLQQSGVFFWEYDLKNNKIFCDDKAVNLFGVPHVIEGVTQSALLESIVAPDSIQEYYRIVSDMHNGIKTSSGNIKLMFPDGDVWYKVTYTSTFDENGKPIHAFAYAQNVDSFKQLDEQFKIIFEQQNLYYWIIDFAENQVVLSEKMKQDYGSVMLYCTCNDKAPDAEDFNIHNEDVAACTEVYEKLFAGERQASLRIRKKNLVTGKWDWLLCTYSATYDNAGKLTRVIASGSNINELVEKEEKYSNFVDHRIVSLKNAMLAVKMNLSKNYCFESENKVESYVKFGASTDIDTFFSNISKQILDPKDKAKFLSICSRNSLLANYANKKYSDSFECRYYIEGYREKWVRIEYDLIENPMTGDVEALLCAVDIDLHRVMENTLAKLADTDYDYIGVIDMETDRITNYTPSVLTPFVTPYGKDNYSKALRTIVKSEIEDSKQRMVIQSMGIDTIRRELLNKEVYTVQVDTLADHGDYWHKRWRFRYLDDRHRLVIATRTDITEILHAEERQRALLTEALAQAEAANLAKTQFLSRMSHEIRTPMNAIIGMTALAEQCVTEPERVANFIEKVSVSARFLLSLINDILDMSRIESGKVTLKKEIIPFEEFIDGINTICSQQAITAGVNYHYVIDGKVEEHYVGDAMKLQQVVINVLSNAVKFTPKGGNVTLTIRQENLFDDIAQLTFTIKDTGIGISKEFLPYLFDAFEQENATITSTYSGTGLGLAICKNLVNLMDGTIDVKSEKNKGSEFIISVPLELCKEEQTKNTGKRTDFDNLHALIVDDDIIVCEQAASVCADIGIKSDWSMRSSDALTLLTQKYSYGEKFDFILVSWKMPDIDGVEFARKARPIIGDTPIIMFTSHNLQAVKDKAQEAGINCVISKPLFRYSVIAALQQVRSELSLAQNKKDFDFEGRRVLLVEDHEFNIEVACCLLNAKNCLVDVAENGLESVEMFVSHPDDYYSAILMDIRMPIMDGLTAAQNIRKLKKATAKTIPIIAMSANAFDDDIEKSYAAGMNAHLPKPIEPDLLYQTLSDFIKAYENK